eukprot:CCRYP_018182-RA/>CCRYP_018182-RA protein AED:0.41 eAED:0.41 QI:0/0/0/1/0/0/2/0/73
MPVVDCTMLTTLGSLATQQASPTASTLARIHQLCTATPQCRAPRTALDFSAHSDASYLSETNMRSRVGGHFFL